MSTNSIYNEAEKQIEAYFFARWVPDHGYAWVDQAQSAGMVFHRRLRGNAPFLIESPQSKMARRSEPLKEYPLLYREFGRLGLGQDAIREFANVYGWLGVPEMVTIPPDVPKNLQGVARSPIIGAEGVNIWHDEIMEMDLLVQLWDMKTEGRTQDVARFIKRENNAIFLHAGIANKRLLDSTNADQSLDSTSDEDRPGKVWHALIADSQYANAEFFRSLKTDDPSIPLAFYISQQVNERLHQHVSPRILFDKDRLVGKIVPHNLLGALWLQFYQTILGEQRIIKCSVCLRDLDVTESRTTKRMHDRCARREQMRRYHENKKRLKQKESGESETKSDQ